MKKYLLALIPFILFGNDFISNLEYGAMLYKNPRGISCIKCHGSDAQGKLIATYSTKSGNQKQLIAPNITHLKWKVFFYRLKYSKVLKKGKFRVLHYSAMPRYSYLTKQEIIAIYNYIRSLKK